MTKKSESSNSQAAIANPSFLQRIFSIPGDEMATLNQLEKKLSHNLDEFLQESKVAGEIPLKKLSQLFSDWDLPENPRFVSDQVNFLLKNVVPHSVHTASPKFIGHMTSSIPYFLLSLAKCMVALHQNVVKIETSRSFTFLERQTLGMLHQLIYNDSDAFYKEFLQKRDATLGIQCSGGTIANITAMWVARNRFIKNTLGKNSDEGNLIDALLKSGYRNICILVSERGHYSLGKSLDLLGIGKQSLKRVKVNADHTLNLKNLTSVYKSCIKENILPIALVGIAGSTETGSVDPLGKLAQFAKSKNLYFHVDAAWGGATLFSTRYAKKLKGIELADSVVIDGHKQLYLPMGVGMLLFKDPAMANYIEHKANYIIRSKSLDLGKRSLEGSRPGMALLTHSALHILGRKGYEILIDQNINLAKTFAKLISGHEHFELVTKPHLNILTYRFVPFANKKNVLEHKLLTKLNIHLQKDQREKGVSFVSRTTFRHQEPAGEFVAVLRSVLANPLTTKQDLIDILTEQSELGFEIINKNTEMYSSLRGVDS